MAHEKTTRLVLLATLILSASATIIIGDPFPVVKLVNTSTYNWTNTVQIRMSDLFVLDEADPATTEFSVTVPTGDDFGDLFNYTVPVKKTDIQLNHSPRIVDVLAKNTFLVSYAESNLITLVTCRGAADDLSCTYQGCDPESKFHKDDQVESGVFDDKTQMYYIVMRDTSNSNNVLKLYSFKPDGSLVSSTNRDITTEGPIVNRAKAVLTQGAKGTTYFWVYDQKTDNGKDQDIGQNVYLWKVEQGVFTFVETYTLLEDNLVSGSVGTIYELKNNLVVSSQRTVNNKSVLCLTRLELEAGTTNLSPSENNYWCPQTNPTSGYIGINLGDKAFLYNKDTNELNVFTIYWPTKYTAGPQIDDYDVAEINGDALSGIRDIYEGDMTYAIRMASDLRIDDSGNNTIIIANNELQNQFVSADGAVNGLVSGFNIEVNDQFLNIYSLSLPFLRFSSDDLEDAETQVVVKATDSGTTEPVLNPGTVIIVSDPFKEIVVSKEEHPTTEIYPSGVGFHPLKWSDIQAGNDIKFSINYTDEAKPNITQQLVGVATSYFGHDVDFSEEISVLNVDKLNFFSGGAVVQDYSNNLVYFFQCSEENRFNTVCRRFGQTKTYSMKIQGQNNGFLDVIYGFTYGTQESGGKTYEYSFFNWYQEDGDWQYEHYEGRILDGGHVKTSYGSVFTVLAFKDHIMISVFYKDWYYGNRDTIKFYKEDVMSQQLCPSQVIFNPNKRNNVFVLSDCPGEQQLIEFLIDDEDSVRYINSHYIGSDLSDPEICMLKKEIVIYEQINKRITSIDRLMGFTNINLPLADYDIQNVNDFVCYPQKNLYAILNSRPGPVGQSDTTEVVFFNGGSQLDANKRIKSRLTGLSEKNEGFQLFTHMDDVVISLQRNDQSYRYIKFTPTMPRLMTMASAFDLDKPEGVEAAIILSSQKGSAQAMVEARLKILPNLEMKAPILRKDKEVLKEGIASNFNYLMDVENTPIERVQLNAKAQQFFTMTSSNDFETVQTGLNDNVGKFVQVKVGLKEHIDFMAFYSKGSRMNYGIIKSFGVDDKGVYYHADTYYGSNAFNSVSVVNEGQYSFFGMISNEGEYSSLQLTLADKDQFSAKTVTVDDFSSLTSVDIFVTVNNQEQKGADPQFRITLLAYSEFNAQMVAYTYDVLLPGGDKDNFKVGKVNVAVSTNDYKATSVVQQIDKKSLNIYFTAPGKIGNKTATAWVTTLDQTKTTFGTPTPLRFEDPVMAYESEVINIGCMRFNNAAEAFDRCAFATYGAVVYYSQMTFAEGKVTQKVRRLRRLGTTFGYNVMINENVVMLETMQLTSDDIKTLLLWDITTYDDPPTKSQGPVTDVPVYNSLLMLAGGQQEKLTDSRFLFSSVEFNSVGFFYKVTAYFQNRPNTGTKVQVEVGKKVITPWMINLKGDKPSEADFNDCTLTLTGNAAQTVDVKFSDFLMYSAPAPTSSSATGTFSGPGGDMDPEDIEFSLFL
jgi:hypothetical protein